MLRVQLWDYYLFTLRFDDFLQIRFSIYVVATFCIYLRSIKRPGTDVRKKSSFDGWQWSFLNYNILWFSSLFSSLFPF